jgi:hypothetical protein
MIDEEAFRHKLEEACVIARGLKKLAHDRIG